MQRSGCDTVWCSTIWRGGNDGEGEGGAVAECGRVRAHARIRLAYIQKQPQHEGGVLRSSESLISHNITDADAMIGSPSSNFSSQVITFPITIPSSNVGLCVHEGTKTRLYTV